MTGTGEGRGTLRRAGIEHRELVDPLAAASSAIKMNPTLNL